MENVISGIKENNLKLTLAFGIGLHHAGLHERDRKTVEELFVNQKIQILIATSTLAWGVNFPAHLVVVKGTEYYDGKTRRYVDFPITDVLQMMGRAGRPQFDDQGVAVILVHDIKKQFYKKFLYEPFPVESSLLEVLPDHLNAELVAGTINSKQDTMDYITWTYFFRRLLVNPSYYQLESIDHAVLNRYLSTMVEKALKELTDSYCVEEQEDLSLCSTVLGRISSYYYLNHLTVRMFREDMMPACSMEQLINVLSNAHEYAELPVRHNEDAINSDLAKQLPLPVNPHTMDSSHTKTHLLLQAHFSQTQLPSSDYLTDTKSVLDQAIRILQAMLDVAADQGWLVTALRCVQMVQQVVGGRWVHESSLLLLPHVQPYHVHGFSHGGRNIEGLAQLIHTVAGRFETLNNMLQKDMSATQISQIYEVLGQLPVIRTSLSIKGWWEGQTSEQCLPVPMPAGRGRQEDLWVPVHADQQYVIQVDLRRDRNHGNKRPGDSKAYTPRFPKPKDEGWFLVLGEVDCQELIALKRVSYVRGQSTQQVAFYTPESPGRVIYTLYLMSDSYTGLDQQYDLHLDVTPASIEAQVNSELSGGD